MTGRFRQELPDDVREEIEQRRRQAHKPPEYKQHGPEPAVGGPPFPWMTGLAVLGVLIHAVWFAVDAVLTLVGLTTPTDYPIIRNGGLLFAASLYFVSWRGAAYLNKRCRWKREALDECGKTDRYWRRRDSVLQEVTLWYMVLPFVAVPVGAVVAVSWLVLYG
jgi:hypothetical protein